jgi:hypothetical protein
MSTTVEDPVAADSPERSPRPAPNPLWRVVWKVVRPLASLQLTVVLFALSMVLVFFGTLAQVDKGIWTVVDEYFRSWYVWIPFQLTAEFGKKFFDLSDDTTWKGSFPFPGGWLIGGVMLVNLLAAHLVRFKLAWNRTGIILIHSGVIILMGGELVTGLYAVESRMVLQTGEKTGFIDHSTKVELAIIDESGQETSRTVTVPQSMLKSGGTISHPDLPFDVRVSEFLKNTDLHPTSGGDDTDVLVRVDGVRYRVVPASEQPGVKSEREDAVAVRVTLLKKGTEEVVLPERLLSLWQYDNYNGRAYMSLPVRVTADGKPYRVLLRNERIPKPYTVELLQFEHKQYAGTTTPKDFASTVRVTDPETGEDWEQRIWMNHPLRHRGETFYQASTVYGDTGTVLQVVKNPGWLLPYISCAVVTLGMLIHFSTGLRKFINREAAA